MLQNTTTSKCCMRICCEPLWTVAYFDLVQKPGESNVVPSDAAEFVCEYDNFHFSIIGQVQVWMMPLHFGDSTKGVDRVQSCLKMFRRECSDQHPCVRRILAHLPQHELFLPQKIIDVFSRQKMGRIHRTTRNALLFVPTIGREVGRVRRIFHPV